MQMVQGHNYENTIFNIEIEKIKPNPYQPRRDFDENALRDLSESIRQYGVLQPLTVSRQEVIQEDGGMVTEYELVAGERRLRASKLAGLSYVPAVIRHGDDNLMKLELAIIENLQREDLNSIDRARAFMRFIDEFNYSHAQVAKKVGKSREYVSNTLRILVLPEEILNALSAGLISEGHTRPLLMLSDRPEEQNTLLKEIMYKKISVREAERIARRIAYDKARKKDYVVDTDLMDLEEKLQEKLGTRVKIDKKDFGGQITIDFFSNDDVRNLLTMVQSVDLPDKNPAEALENYINSGAPKRGAINIDNPYDLGDMPIMHAGDVIGEITKKEDEEEMNKSHEAVENKEDEDLYSVSSFSI